MIDRMLSTLHYKANDEENSIVENFLEMQSDHGNTSHSASVKRKRCGTFGALSRTRLFMALVAGWEALTRKVVEKVTIFDPGLNPECCWLQFFFCITFLIRFFGFKAYEKQKQTRKSTTQLQSKSGEREKVEKFKTTENSIVSKPINPFMFGNYQ